MTDKDRDTMPELTASEVDARIAALPPLHIDFSEIIDAMLAILRKKGFME